MYEKAAALISRREYEDVLIFIASDTLNMISTWFESR